MRRVGAAAVLALVALACRAGVEEGGGAFVPAGDRVKVAGWDLRTVDTRTDRPADISSGRQAFDVRITAWFSGNGTTTFESDIVVSAGNPSGVIYQPNFVDCPDGLEVDRSVRPDEVVEGFICFEMDPAHVDDLYLILTASRDAGDPTLLEVVDPVIEKPDDFGPDEVVEDLEERGVEASLVPSPYAPSSFLTRAKTEHVLCLNGEEAILFEYATEELRRVDSDLVLPTGGFKSGHFDLLYGRVMWWARGRVIVNYNLARSELWGVLTAVLGETLSSQGEAYGEPPDPAPPSEVCTRPG